MNRYMEQNSEFNSNRRIMEAYFGEAELRPSRALPVWERLLAILSAIRSFLTGVRVKRLVRPTLLSLCLFAFVGIIGAMERGTLGLGLGLLIGLCLIGLEYLCLCKLGKKR